MERSAPPSRSKRSKPEGEALNLLLFVEHGANHGARLAIDEHLKVVGRARDAHLSLTDLKVSRRHMEVRREGEEVVVRLCRGAAKMLVRGDSVEEAVVRVGDAIVLGDTVLVVVTDAPEPRVEVTSVSTLLEGRDAGARDLGAIFSLDEALEGAQDVAAIRLVVERWSPRLGVKARLVLDDEAGERQADRALFVGGDQIGTRKSHAGDVVAAAVPIPADPPAHLWVEIPSALATAETQRVLAVAARLVGSNLTRLKRHAALEARSEELRRLALGSARGFLGDSPAAAEVARVLPKLAASSATVLVLGESGTGKTFLARLIHEQGARANEPFRVINCAAVPEHLLEGELFGHERGAFTGATASRPGAFEAVGKGTLLLDEIAELPLTSQAKLLRVLEDRRFERLGSNQAITLQARVVAATNRDLKELVAEGRFRADLYFRVSVVSVRVPSLRERGKDLALLSQQILLDLAPSAGRRVKGFSPEALLALEGYPWPGNVRELRNAIEHALVLGDGETIEPRDLPEVLRGATRAEHAESGDPDLVRLPLSLDELEVRAIEAALRATGGNRAQAAALLGINRATLFKKLREPPST